ncbi:uncharacterized protein BP5553_05482 [Venustampulla echinocandica]|uniref:RRM domain-containing protein n=1 Tax=Venustampulla echinocandica TaxID=2656787 RepID=A0A370TRA0_9HELO|nr:uncharacterized protein BP5553_05482 [Venustampulla echinocandica]RDL38049.1 hypothetical protein BP5553_05482 [Venustampulla echinocandica]
MAKDTVSKKRKASVPESGAEKVKKIKKVEVTEVPVKKRKAIDDAGVSEIKKSKKAAKSAKSAVEESATLDKHDKETNGDSKTPKAKKKDTRSSKAANGEPKTKKSEPAETNNEEAEEVGSEDDDNASVIDDQTEALLEGFESDRDEADNSNDQGLEPGQGVPELKLSKKEKKQLKKASEAAALDKPGVVYVGRIPHGFYEHEMREYFKQFGTILKLRLSRNRTTGASKHYAFIQFDSAAVAEIVSKAMDNYLLFGHILKVKFVPEEQVPANVFKGANKRFKKVPWNKIEGRKLAQGASEETWAKRIELEEKKRAAKAEKLKSLGYEFNSPQIKSAKGVAKEHVVIPAVEANGESEPLAIEESPSDIKAIEVAPSTEDAKSKKSKKTKAVDTPKEAVADTTTAPAEELEQPKRKEKKSKIAKGEEPAADGLSGDVVEEKVERPKRSKSKKGKTT